MTEEAHHDHDPCPGEFSSLQLAIRCLWAKSNDHGLLAHMLDVAAVTEALLQVEPRSSLEWAARSLGLTLEQLPRWLATLVGLHDFGKSILGFVCKWPEGLQRALAAGLTFGMAGKQDVPHALASAILLEPLLRRRVAAHDWVRHVVQAISAHHGYHLASAGAKLPLEGREWGPARQGLFDIYWSVLNPTGEPQAEELSTPAVEWLAGLTSVADWIGSNVEWFPPGERCDRFEDYFDDARRRAVAALQAIGWTGFRALLEQPAAVDTLIERIVQRPDQVHTARPLQRAADQLLSGASGPALLLVEAPMGEGKTELAFLAHLRLQAANGHRGLFVALPTRATGNALFTRALTFLRAFAHQQPIDMQLVQGGASLNEQVRHLQGIFGAQGDRAENVSASAWFSQRRRPLLSPYGVGTIDQALFAVLNVKHHFVRLWGLSNRVVVLDEVHAYDTYTSGLIEALLGWLRALGSSVVLMSATLPRARRDALLQAWGGAPGAIPELPYPRLLLADERGIAGATFGARTLPSIHLEAISEDLDALADCALERLASGGCGAVIVNTVQRAQDLYRRLKARSDQDADLLLFHARFPADQRAGLEQAVLSRFGPEGERPAKALLIATQVAEQSLDIDFDFMLTDLAPVDLILQRAGRLHRHLQRQWQRPAAHALARLWVAGLHPEQLPDLKQTAWQYVYEPHVLGRTWALLRRESVLSLPEDIDRLVQSVYGDAELPPDLGEKVRAFIEIDAKGEHLAKQTTERQKAVNIAIDPVHEPQSAYLNKPVGHEEGEGLGLKNRTRLGDDAITLVPVHVAAEGWSLEPGGAVFDPRLALSDELASALYARQLSVARKHLVAHFGRAEVPRAFAEHPLLRHLKPLPLRDGVYETPELGPSLRLDPELGLLIE